jgi:2-oxoglutarate ferredoxin oxidoreductase subunit alpha
VRFTTSSHDEHGYLTKDPRHIGRLNQHLAEKINAHIDEISIVNHDLQNGSETLILSYGITAQSAQSAAQKARQLGKSVSVLTIHSLWPVPEWEIRSALKGARRIVVPELNLGQYRREIERLAHDHQEVVGVNRVDGELIPPDDILERCY